MSIELAFENATSCNLPRPEDFQTWVSAALAEHFQGAELSMRIVDETEMTELNKYFRDQDKPTNVLSFPAEIPTELQINLLGDIAICAPVIEREASEQGKQLEAHYAHMSVHGALHLAGYDHIDEADAKEMETLEIKILNTLGFANPYQDQQN